MAGVTLIARYWQHSAVRGLQQHVVAWLEELDKRGHLAVRRDQRLGLAQK